MFQFLQRRSPAVFVIILLIVFLYQFPVFWDQFRSRTPPSQAASIFAVSPKRYTRTLVVASTRSEDVSWVAKEFPDLTHAIYVADDPTAPLHPPENKGRESTIYLTYIIDHYHNLSEITIFTHAQQEAWHNNDLFDLDLVRMVRSLSDEHVAKSGFFNLRCHAESGCPDHIHPRKEASTEGQGEEIYFRQVWHELHDPDVPLPELLAAPCCSQFAASRERIQSISLQRWKKYQQWLLDTSLPDEISGRIWEFTWHLILTGQAVLCHPIEQCYCKGYGLCFESTADIHAWLAMKEVLLLAKDRQEDLFRQGLNTESIGYRIVQKIERPMRKWWHEAELRGRGMKTEGELGEKDKQMH